MPLFFDDNGPTMMSDQARGSTYDLPSSLGLRQRHFVGDENSDPNDDTAGSRAPGTSRRPPSLTRKPPPRASLVASSSIVGKFVNPGRTKDGASVTTVADGMRTRDEGGTIVRHTNDNYNSDDGMIAEDVSLWVVGYGESEERNPSPPPSSFCTHAILIDVKIPPWNEIYARIYVSLSLLSPSQGTETWPNSAPCTISYRAAGSSPRVGAVYPASERGGGTNTTMAVRGRTIAAMMMIVIGSPFATRAPSTRTRRYVNTGTS